jgi:hypothetical protein
VPLLLQGAVPAGVERDPGLRRLAHHRTRYVAARASHPHATSAALAALTLPAAATTYHPQHRVDGDYTITINGSNAYPESIVADNRHAHTGLWPAAPSCGHPDRVIARSPGRRAGSGG